MSANDETTVTSMVSVEFVVPASCAAVTGVAPNANTAGFRLRIYPSTTGYRAEWGFGTYMSLQSPLAVSHNFAVGFNAAPGLARGR